VPLPFRSSPPVKRFCLLFLLPAPAGCNTELKPGAESIFEAFGDEISPGELAAMSIDPYDANNRYRGTLGLSAAYFANEPVYIALFEDNIDDPDPAVRMAATRGLANHGEPRHMPLLLNALNDTNKVVRLEAARGLQRIHDPSAVAPLIVAVREPVPEPDRERRGQPAAPGEVEPEIRAEAADALGQYAELRVLHALVAALDDSDLAVNSAALRSLRTLTGQDFGVDRATWADWLTRTNTPFAGRQLYTYPAYNRALRFYEYIPFVPKPLNEVAAPPAGMPRG
jgi:HEAT repeat protein